MWNPYESLLYMLLGAFFLAHVITSFMKSLCVQDIQTLLHHSRLHLVSTTLETKCLSSDPTSVTIHITADPSPLNLASMLLGVLYGVGTWLLYCVWVLRHLACLAVSTVVLTDILIPCISVNEMAAAHTCSSHICTTYRLSIKTY